MANRFDYQEFEPEIWKDDIALRDDRAGRVGREVMDNEARE
jgi:hypothetical protein